MGKSISIYVAYHKPSALPDDNGSFHIPIHVGRALSDQQIEGAIGDDTGDNISSLNPLFCELTATYWAWKNDNTSDYIGICHYRRFFTYDHPNFFSSIWRRFKIYRYRRLSPNEPILLFFRVKCSSAERLKRKIASFEKRLVADVDRHSVDIVCLKAVRSTFILEQSQASKPQQTKEIVKEHYPDFYPFVEQLYQSKSFSYANMVIMKREIFDEYCTLLFGILDKHRQMGYSKQEEMRLYGYIAENLTAAFINYKQATSGAVVRSLHQLLYTGQ